MPHFGPYKKEREQQIEKINLNKTNVDTDVKNNSNAMEIKNGLAEIPKIRDVIGKALPKIGAYNNLNNKEQVVALIDDVSTVFLKLVRKLKEIF